MVANMHGEGLPPHTQSYEFTPQLHHHKQDNGYNLQFFSATREDFMSNLMDTNLWTLEFAYAYMQSMFIHSFASFHQSIIESYSTNDFVQEEQLVVPDEQVEPWKHGWVHWQSTRNKQPPKCETGGHKRH